VAIVELLTPNTVTTLLQYATPSASVCESSHSLFERALPLAVSMGSKS
jgi:hypothetical protein